MKTTERAPAWLRARFALELWWRARVLPWRMRRDLPIAGIEALATPPEGAPLAGLGAGEIAARVRRAVRHPIMMREQRCLREGVLCFRFLRMAGFAPRLHFGIDPAARGSKFSAHCWVTLDGKVLAGDLGVPMTALHVFPGDAGQAADGAPRRT